MQSFLVKSMRSPDVRSHILISSDIEEELKVYEEQLKPSRVVSFLREDFKVEDARAVIAEAYISEASTKYIILASRNFNVVSQNALLKALEEPPRHIEFILIAPSKSLFLPTIRSRLPLMTKITTTAVQPIDISLKMLDLAQLFDFVKTHERLKKHEAKGLIEALFHHGSVTESLVYNMTQLEAFDRAFRLLDLNARVGTVLSMLLMTFLPKREHVTH